MGIQASCVSMLAAVLSILLTIPGAFGQADCSRDRMKLAESPTVRNVAAAFHLDLSSITFQSCHGIIFSTAYSGGVATINYPSSAISADLIIGAITHELAHVYQLRKAGNVRELRRQMNNSIERIELSADFLSGYVFRHYLPGIARAEFQTSLELVGSYNDAAGKSHGTPEERVVAFRLGYYHSEQPKPIDDLYRFFQSDGFGFVKRGRQ